MGQLLGIVDIRTPRHVGRGDSGDPIVRGPDAALHRYIARLAVLVLGLIAFPWPTAVLGAHEIGTTRVAIVALDRSRFDLELVTDATSLLGKMESVAGEPLSSSTDPADLQRRLQALGSVFQQRVVVDFGRHSRRAGTRVERRTGDRDRSEPDRDHPADRAGP